MIKPTIAFCLYSLFFPLTFSTISTGSIGEVGVNIASTSHNIYTFMRQKDHYETYEGFISQLNEYLNMVLSAEKMNKQPNLSQEQLNNIKKSYIKLNEFSKDKLTFDIENVFSKKSSTDTKLELENVLLKLNTDMTDQLRKMLHAELIKSGLQTARMIKSLYQTFSLIKKSQQFHESSALQSAINQSQEHLDKAEKFHRIVDDEFIRMEITPNVHTTGDMLEKIAFNLDKAKLECDWAQRILTDIINDIRKNLESLSSERKRHIWNFLSSILDIIAIVIEYINTPKSILTDAAKFFFSANAGLNTVNAFGHTIGFYWAHEEIKTLEKHQNKLDTLKIMMKDSFHKIEYGMEKLEKLKQFNQN
jgi:hypothetical protein